MAKSNVIKLGEFIAPSMSKYTFGLDLDRLIETRAVATASSGAGKSFLIRRLVEQAYGKKQVIIIDVEGEFHTMRPEFDFVIVGKGGDVDLVPQHAATYARKFLELRRDVVFDLSELEPKVRRAFVSNFFQAMLDAPRNLQHDVLLILDEAHEFAPEKSPAESSSAVISMASKGRKRGYSLVAATQRFAKLSKDVAAECANKLIGQLNLPVDRERAGKELGFTARDQVLLLRDLERGTFFACGPAFQRSSAQMRDVNLVAIDLPKTRPPKRGSLTGRAPAASSKLKLELAKLRELPKEAEQEAKDLAGLKAELGMVKHELTRTKAQLLKASAPRPIHLAPDPKAIELIHAEAKKQADARLQVVGRTMGASMMAVEQILGQASLMLQRGQKQLMDGHDFWTADFKRRPELLARLPKRITGRHLTAVITDDLSTPFTDAAVKASLAHVEKFTRYADLGEPSTGKGKHSPCEKAIVSFLSIRPDEWFDNRRIAAMAEYSASSGSFRNALSALNTAGIIERKGKQTRLRAGIGIEGLMDGRVHTLEAWIAKMSPCEKAIVKHLRQTAPNGYDKADLAELSGYQATSGSFRNAFSRLTTMGLIQRKGETFFLHPDAESFA